MSQENSHYLIVLTTSPGNITAKKIANALVEAGTAACVNILPPMSSVFFWQGRVEQEEEQLLIIKTAASAYQAVENIIKAHHPYEVPEIVAVSIVQGLPAYLAWIDQTVTTEST